MQAPYLISGYSHSSSVDGSPGIPEFLEQLPSDKKSIEEWAAAFCRQLRATDVFSAASKCNYLLCDGHHAKVVIFLGFIHEERRSLHALIIKDDTALICTAVGHEATDPGRRAFKVAIVEQLQQSMAVAA